MCVCEYVCCVLGVGGWVGGEGGSEQLMYICSRLSLVACIIYESRTAYGPHRSHLGICSPLKPSLVSNDSV